MHDTVCCVAVCAVDTEPWGIISIKPQMVDYELPMNPITMMRNALGVRPSLHPYTARAHDDDSVHMSGICAS